MQSGAVEDGLPNVTAARTPRIQAYFDEATNSVSYLVADPATGEAAIIDPVLGFDVTSGKIDNEAAGRRLMQLASDHLLDAPASQSARPYTTPMLPAFISFGRSKPMSMPTICRRAIMSGSRRGRSFARAPEFSRSKVSLGRSLELTT